MLIAMDIVKFTKTPKVFSKNKKIGLEIEGLEFEHN